MPGTKVRKEPEIIEMPARRMAVVHSTGDPNEVGETVFKALYGAVYPLKFALKKQGVAYKMEPPRARWWAGEKWRDVPREQWKASWGIPIPDDVDEVSQKVPAPAVVVETWEYGKVAQLLHVGSYADEEPAIERLHAFIEEQGLEIAGPHEEEYLTGPGVKVTKTMIRYQVRPRAQS